MIRTEMLVVRREGKPLRASASLFVLLMFFLSPLTAYVHAGVLFSEDFENNNFASRGWYDNPRGTIVTDARPGSTGTRSFQCDQPQGANGCTGGAPARHLFTPTNSIYISYWQKYSANYATDGHEIYILTTADDSFAGLAANKLDLYLQKEFRNGNGKLSFELQDVLMIDQSKVGVDLKSTTENRAIAGCNGNTSNTGGTYDCYKNGTIYYNDWVITTNPMFTTSAGALYKNDWHRIEVYAQLNTISGGKGQNDGILQYWFDGVLVLDKRDVMFRTGVNPNMQFNQFIIGPYIGAGAAVNQSFWIDDLVVATDRPNTTPSPPTLLQVK